MTNATTTETITSTTTEEKTMSDLHKLVSFFGINPEKLKNMESEMECIKQNNYYVIKAAWTLSKKQRRAFFKMLQAQVQKKEWKSRVRSNYSGIHTIVIWK